VTEARGVANFGTRCIYETDDDVTIIHTEVISYDVGRNVWQYAEHLRYHDIQLGHS